MIGLDMKNILPWMMLQNVPGIGNHLFKKLIDRFKTPETVFSTDIPELVKVEGISARLAHAIKLRKTSDEMQKELDLVFKKNFNVVTMADRNYPALLHQLPDPPPILYISGIIDETVNNIAVVGSRNATRYGISMANQLAGDLAAMGINIVSGMARGIDTAAHLGALGAKGKTVAVLGSGLARIYPPENRKLFHDISENGAVVSEFPLFAEPEAHHFPLRNRIICGMCLGTIVVEAARRSGSLITARLAVEQGREVFAVPGSVRSFKSTGTHGLLKQGAKLVEHVNDVIEEIRPLVEFDGKERPKNKNHAKKSLQDLDPDEMKVYEALEPYPVHIDDLSHMLGFDSGKTAGILLELELKGLVNQSPGKLFSAKEE
jgi:DNA processing protein